MRTPLYVTTPLLKGTVLDEKYLPGTDIYFKTESQQPSGSFKMRGISWRCQKAVENGCNHFVGSSAGNAALALALSAKLLNIKCTIVVPKSASQRIINTLKEKSVNFIVEGHDFQAANEYALELAKELGVAYIHPYDHPDVWEGNSFIVDEIKQELKVKPSAVVVAVGGGGFLVGIMDGLKRNGWGDVPLIGMETVGANCLNETLKAKKKVFTEVTSIACLGARSVTDGLIERLDGYKVISEVVTDKQAVESSLKFYESHNIIVEPASGAALSALYCGILSKLEKEGKLQIKGKGPVVVVVCGGSGVNLEMLNNWAETL